MELAHPGLFISVSQATQRPTIFGFLAFDGTSLEKQSAHRSNAVRISEGHDLEERMDIAAESDIGISLR
eukprot:2062467-Karenia_brevis.AAC.1